MCALNTKVYNHEVKLYYERKVAEGKSKMLVLNNIRNKILGRVFAVANRGWISFPAKKQLYINLLDFFRMNCSLNHSHTVCDLML